MSLEAPALTPDLYDHLRSLAGRIFAERGHGHASIQPTVLLHEAWMKVANSKGTYESRAHFMAVSARAMRQILVDRARARASLKRGQNARATTLHGLADGNSTEVLDVLDVDAALKELETLDPRGAEIVQMRIFGGLTVQEVAKVLDVSPRTVDRTWRFARAFLVQRLHNGEASLPG